jgi:hypothetical protein
MTHRDKHADTLTTATMTSFVSWRRVASFVDIGMVKVIINFSKTRDVD